MTNLFFENIVNFFRQVPVLTLIMSILCIIAIITFCVDGNWPAVIWAFNTFIWVIIAALSEMEKNNQIKRNSELLEENHRLWDENEELKNNK